MQDKDYLIRCIELAKLGGKEVRPNPHVGSMIVYNGKIIGEGFHETYGGSHAEVNAINSVSESNEHFLSESTIYVSLEPCCHFGITPPCTDLIIKNKIPRVCIAEIDPTQKVNSKGINQLKKNGIEVVIIPIPEFDPIAEFRVNQLKQRPFVQLKFAKSKDHYIGQKDKQIWLSNETSNVYTHKLRSYTDAILIGTNTALIDNPSLTLRNFPGKPPMRIILDREGKIPDTHTLLADPSPCIIFTEHKRNIPNSNKQQIEIDFLNENFIDILLKKLHSMNVYHLMVEGGAAILKSFVRSNNWDEAVVIRTTKVLSNGLKAININGKIKSGFTLGNDEVLVIKNEVV